MKTKFMHKLINCLIAVAFFSSCSGSNSDTSALVSDIKSTKMEEPRTNVLIETSMGDITIELYNETPEHRDNFVKLVKDGYYVGTLFHRVINQFMIQGGDPDSKNAEPGQQLGSGGPGYTVKAEFVDGLYHEKGALAAARQGDNVNPEKRSSGSQFYIVQGRPFSHEELDMMEQKYDTSFSNEQRKIYTTIGGTPHLDGDYTVYGKVIDGLEVVDKIASVKTDRNNRPIEDVEVKMSIIE